MVLYSYAGKILRVNLSKKTIKAEDTRKDVAQLLLGGNGYAAKILWDELKPGVDPLSPENKIVLMTGPITGTGAPGSGFWEACFKSPLTGVWGESACGGWWGPMLKFAGFDGIIIEGASKDPVYLWVHDGEAEIKPAEGIWGQTVPKTEEAVRKEIGVPQARVLSIGPAGEKLVRFAGIAVDLERYAGRKGGGALLGSKKVKAVAVYGEKEIPIAKPAEYGKALKECEQAVYASLNSGGGFPNGTLGGYDGCNQFGDLPTKYGETGSWEAVSDLYVNFVNKYLLKNRACFGCMQACGRVSRVEEGPFATPVYGGPEYETTAGFTTFALQKDIEPVIKANYLCNIYGLDTISTSHMIAFAMICYEKGLITKKDTDGLEVKWGDANVMINLIEKIAYREGFGDLLAEGVRRAAEKIGGDAQKIALHVKGLEMPYHDPRAGKTQAIEYGTSNTGMDHFHAHETLDVECYGADLGLIPFGLPDPKTIDRFSEDPSKASIAKLVMDWGTVADALVICKFHQYVNLGPDKYAKLLSLATGWKIDGWELLKIGDRIFNLGRAFNVREGIRRKDDMLPPRIMQPATTGSTKGVGITNYEGMLNEFYKLEEWDENGIPKPEKLKRLGLDDVASYIASLKA
ncbi:aldehyde ferredoxin oxidoreductase family protein [Candidatus Bathyarchaeota archaeon]|nr:aldehyde ferredoxin oxidoreductase family protein [Candidatus Bathyarchaeota archaeon]